MGKVKRHLRTAGLISLSWVMGAVIVRLGLNLLDFSEYSALKEYLYMLVALMALSVSILGTIIAIRRPQSSKARVCGRRRQWRLPR